MRPIFIALTRASGAIVRVNIERIESIDYYPPSPNVLAERYNGDKVGAKAAVLMDSGQTVYCRETADEVEGIVENALLRRNDAGPRHSD